MRPNIQISIANQQKHIRLQRRLIEKAVTGWIAHFRSNAYLELAYVNNRKIRDLNRRFLGYAHTTDVLAFPLNDKPGELEGEIVVSAELARSEALKRKVSLHQELLLYTLHGLLHLLGYDHNTEKDREDMQTTQDRLMQEYFGGFTR